MNDALQVRVLAADRVDDARRAEMYALFETYYDDVTEARFGRDLDAKTDVILLLDGERVVGFSTLEVHGFRFAGRDECAIFSGDTIIARPWWGTQLLSIAFCRFAGRTSARLPGRRLWWLLISKGHRTYRYLNAFAVRFHPSPQANADLETRSRAEMLARARFGDAYDPVRGVLRFDEPSGHLRPCWHVDPGARAGSASSRYFETRNPGFAKGDELVCLAELSAANLKRLARRAFVDGVADAPAAGHRDGV
ncbi:MAG: hypothetical protein AB7P21_10290 [Lautropia sp.]